MKRTRARRDAAQPRLVLDSGGLSALVGSGHVARGWLRWIVENGGALCVPTPILVECTTGDAGRDAEVNRVLTVLSRYAAAIEAPDERIARRAGALRFRARTDDGVDALVAAAAAAPGVPTVVLTSDPHDLRALLVSESQVHVRRV
jgi:hypothetical protein